MKSRFQRDPPPPRSAVATRRINHQLSPPDPVRHLDEKHVITRRGEEPSRVAAENEVTGVAVVFLLPCPHRIQRGAWLDLPSKHRVHLQRLEVEVWIVEGKGGSDTERSVGVDGIRVRDRIEFGTTCAVLREREGPRR